ncbi:HNH endonuclease signature motif containing protein [Streptomyces bacillaris]|uniref:HNH endonuclease signature motif containing protein n=1 Tax=Streptomyces bacillaris TaxID=68179 RepID=UPI0034607EFF
MTTPDHWQEDPGAWRTTPRPRGWKALRAQALERDGAQCTWIDDGERCPEPGTDADHIGDSEDHRLDNLRMLCGYHHRKRTAMQARAARGPIPSRRRPAEPHPGLLPQPATSQSRAAGARKQPEDDVAPF